MNFESDIILSPQAEKVRALGHHYCIQTIQLAVQEIINCGSSLRGVEKIFELYEEFTSLKAPSFSSIRKWLGRIGLYELNREKEYRTDWIFIIDLTVELGTQKCLVVLGVSKIGAGMGFGEGTPSKRTFGFYDNRELLYYF